MKRCVNVWSMAVATMLDDGDHTNHIASRFQDHALPFFGQPLTFLAVE